MNTQETGIDSFIEKLISSSPVVTDGAWGTEMQAQGLPPGEFPDLWNLANPGAVHRVAQAYVDAGSRVILTNTFGANRLRIADHEAATKVSAINQTGVKLSRCAAVGRAAVFASIGPSGRMLMMGEISPEELEEVFTEQAEALADGGADAIVVETMSDPEEARIAVRAARSTGLPVVGCMVFDSGKAQDQTMMGTTVEEAVEALVEAGAHVIGANCGQGIEGLIAICRRLRAATSRPIWIKANAGLPELLDGRAVYRTTAEEFAQFVPALVEAGANFIGGCCGTNPEFIRLVAAELSRADV